MSDELTQAPRIEGETWVFPDGRRLPRVRGAEAQPDALEETPAENAAPDNGTPAEQEPSETNWEKRFKDLQPELTRAQQENARLRAVEEALRNPDQAAEVLQQYGYEFGDDVPDPEEQDPALQDPRVDALLAEREQERQLQEQQAGWTQFNTDLDKLAKGKELSPRDRALIYSETLQAGGTPEALSGVFDEFQKEREAYDKAVIQAYVGSKRAPRVSPGGTGATETPFREDMSLDERIAAAQELARLRSET